MDVAVTDIAYQRPVRRWKPERCERIALVLQGGGARRVPTRRGCFKP